MYKVIFKHPDQVYIYPKLLAAVNQVCNDFGKDAECVAGYRSLECQKATNAGVLATRKGSYQVKSGAVYTGTGSSRICWASAYGQSNHCYCIAMDMNGWFEDLSNKQLQKYGLYKPMAHEPWHITLAELVGIGEIQKKAIRDSVLKGVDKSMNIKEFQAIVGLTADGVPGPKTKEKAKEVLQVCQEILGNNFKTAEEVVKATQKSPSMWMQKLKTEKYLGAFVMNIINRMGGKV